jgi:hypothetical protein
MLNRYSRRDWLARSACGFGTLALAGLAEGKDARADQAKVPHHPPRAKRIIFLFMQGGVSHVDSFDYKPRLEQDDGKLLTFDDARIFANTGMLGSSQRVMKPLWPFAQRGQCGRWTSQLFPEISRHVDDLCFVHSLCTEGVAHGPATLFLHCGSTNFIRPSMGSWVVYGLGSENENLPGFISIAPSPGNGGARNYGSAFLPAVVQGTPLGKAGGPVSDMAIRNLTTSLAPEDSANRFSLIRDLNAAARAGTAPDGEWEAIVESYELAWRMQASAPDVLDLSQETRATLDLYGIDQKPTDAFGRQCLMARRLCEAGVRFVQVTYGDGSANPAWDQHSNLPKHAEHALAVDKPVAGLLSDLGARGLLDDTIVWFGSEFGRTPYAEKNGTGRDHNPGGFTVWLAGGGFKAGHAHGATDEFGARAVEGRVHMHDLHATLLYQLGLDHERLTFNYSGRNFRLTDVHGQVIHQVMS